MFEAAALMQDLTDQERLIFQTEISTRRKDPTVGVLLTLFVGGVGAHRFYLGQTGLGVLYVCFCWTFIPMFVSLIELFLISNRVQTYNTAVAQEIAFKLKGLRPVPASQPKGRALPATEGEGDGSGIASE